MFTIKQTNQQVRNKKSLVMDLGNTQMKQLLLLLPIKKVEKRKKRERGQERETRKKRRNKKDRKKTCIAEVVMSSVFLL